MLTEIQKVILTCLLGPEDTKAFANEQSRLRYHALPLEAKKRRIENDKSNAKTYREENPEEARRRNKTAREKAMAEDPERMRGYDRKRRPRGSEANKVRGKKQRTEHPKETQESVRKCKLARRGRDPVFRLRMNLARRICLALNRARVGKSSRTMELTGCPLVWLEAHLESLFKPEMTWKNYGPVWHVDHIKPCAAFDLSNLEQQKICFHWTNLQPLFAAENIAKGDKV